MAPVTPNTGAQPLRIGVIRETKIPSDRRTPLTPQQCRTIMQQHPGVTVCVQSSDIRCYADREYAAEGVAVVDSVADCSVLLGVKEVKLDALQAGKTYFFFSHTIKQQPYNARLLSSILRRRIRLIDYECLRNERGQRVIAFGRWAGIVGAHNTVAGWGLRRDRFRLPQLHECRDFREGSAGYADLDLRGLRVVLTGSGRVATGAKEVLLKMGARAVEKNEFLSAEASDTSAPIFVQLRTADIYKRVGTGTFDKDFYEEPQKFRADLLPFLSRANVLINGIYWDCRAPAFFKLEDVSDKAWSVEVIGDITCDIAPQASVPTTLRPARIGAAYFGFDKRRHVETPLAEAFADSAVTMMTVDNLPNELPRDASEDFGAQFLRSVLPQLLSEAKNEDCATKGMLHSATIAAGGSLNVPYRYLSDYAAAGAKEGSAGGDRAD